MAGVSAWCRVGSDMLRCLPPSVPEGRGPAAPHPSQAGHNQSRAVCAATIPTARRIKMEQLLAAVPQLASALGSGAEDAHRAAVAITTTDLVSKSAALEVELSPGRTVRLGGIAKGSGMIHPNM